jgi:hypothetical protein
VTLATLATLVTTKIRLTIINFRKEMAVLFSQHGARGARQIWRRRYGVGKLPSESTIRYSWESLNKNASLENQVCGIFFMIITPINIVSNILEQVCDAPKDSPHR